MTLKVDHMVPASAGKVENRMMRVPVRTPVLAKICRQAFQSSGIELCSIDYRLKRKRW